MRDLAKREGTHSGRSSNMNSQTNLHVEIYTVTHRHGHVYTHALTCAQIHKHYTCIDKHQHTHTEICIFICSQMCIPSHRNPPSSTQTCLYTDTDLTQIHINIHVHMQACTDISMRTDART